MMFRCFIGNRLLLICLQYSLEWDSISGLLQYIFDKLNVELSEYSVSFILSLIVYKLNCCLHDSLPAANYVFGGASGDRHSWQFYSRLLLHLCADQGDATYLPFQESWCKFSALSLNIFSHSLLTYMVHYLVDGSQCDCHSSFLLKFPSHGRLPLTDRLWTSVTS